jgi:glycosyltransferase involved in cell wall biosynthesis
VRVALLVGGAPPNPTTGGGAVTAWAVMSQLVELGHDVSVIVLADPENESDPAREELVRERGAQLVSLPSRAADVFERLPGGARARVRRVFSSPPETLYPTLVDRPAIRDAVAATGAEAAFVYHFESLAASRDVGIPRFAAVGDPPHLSALYHFRRSPSLRAVGRLQAQVRGQPRLLVEMLNECSAAGAFAAHHAAWLQRKGVDRCEYLRTPVPDPGPTERREAEKPRILLVGHLKGAVTLDGLQRFATGVLPRLENELGPDGFEVRLAGGFDPPPKLARALDRPSVRLLGHVAAAGHEFLSAHVMLVPNSITLGIRVRIITAFAYGCCIVTDRANTFGIPELEHERNALIADSPEGLAQETLRAFGDAALRARLGAAARETYERAFQPRIAVGHIAETLERIAGGRSATAVTM